MNKNMSKESITKENMSKKSVSKDNGLKRNDTGFPMKMTTKLRELYEQYLFAYANKDDTQHHWASALKYYQFLVRTVMSDPEYGIGADGNARGLLIYHTMGMGKTRLAVAVAMALWDIRPVIVMLARSLQENFLETIYEVIDILNNGMSEQEILHKRVEARAKFTFVSMDAYNSANQMARASTSTRKSNITAIGGLDGKLLIIDEAHNFFRAIINSSAENANARRIYEMIMTAGNLRLLFLTGTPAAKDPFEFVPCFNMLAGMDLLPTQYEIFYKFYVDKENHAVKNRDKLANRLIGLVSHVTPGKSSEPESDDKLTKKKIRDDGWFPEELPTIVEKVEMGIDQYRQYLLAREKEENEGKTGDGSGGRTMGVMSTPVLSLPGSEKKAMRSYFVKSRNISTFSPPREWIGKTIDSMPDDIFTVSNGPKLALIAKRADAAVGPVLVYSQFVDIGGLKPVGRYLQQLGYTLFVPENKKSDDKVFISHVVDSTNSKESNSKESNSKESNSKKEIIQKHFAIISGEISSEDRVAIRTAFNSLDNSHGAIIKVILVSKTGAEGLDLKWLRETHQVEPYWDKARDHQITARAIRLGSHDGLPNNEREVQPYLYIAIANQTIYQQMLPQDREQKSIDEIFAERANERYETISAFRSLLTNICLECELFKYGNCRVCVPTNAPLFHDNSALDIRLPDPCEIRQESNVEAMPIIVDDVTYYYRINPLDFTGYSFYLFDKDLGGYIIIDSSNPIIQVLLKMVQS